MLTIVGESVILLMFLAGIILMLLEAIIPGANFVVIGIGLLVTSLIAMLLSITNPVFLIPIFIITGGITLYIYHNYEFFGTEQGKTSDKNSLEMKEAIVIEEVTPTSGRVKLKKGGGMSNNFQARSMDENIPEGTDVVVTDSGGGTILEVMAIDDEDDIDRELNREKNTN